MIVANDEQPGRVDPGDLAFGRKANNFVGRARYDLYAESYLGAIFTHRGFMDSHSTLGALDGNFRLGRTQAVGFKVAQTDHRDMDGVGRQGRLVDLSYRLNSRHWNSFLALFTLSPDFRHDVGFVRRVDTKRLYSRLGYNFWPESWIVNWGPSIQYGRNHNFANDLDDEDVRLGFTARFARNISFNTDVREEMERYRGIRFHKRTVSIGGQVNTSRRLAVGGYYRRGDEVKYQEEPVSRPGGQRQLLRRGAAGLAVPVRAESQRERLHRPAQRRRHDLRRQDRPHPEHLPVHRPLPAAQHRGVQHVRPQVRAELAAHVSGERGGPRSTWATTTTISRPIALYGDIDGDGFEDQLFPTLTMMQQTNRAIFTKVQYLFRY